MIDLKEKENNLMNCNIKCPMPIFTLKRTHRLEFVTYGILEFEDIPFCITLERPWKNNKKDVSCIPVGEYICSRYKSPTYDETFLVNCKDRDYILFHWGNFVSNTKGCILLAEKFQPIGDDMFAVQESKNAFKEFMEKTKNFDAIKLIIINMMEEKYEL